MSSFKRAPPALLIAVMISAMIGVPCFRGFSFGLAEEESGSGVNANGNNNFETKTSTQLDPDDVDVTIVGLNGFMANNDNNPEIETMAKNNEEVETTESYFSSSDLISTYIAHSVQTTVNGQIMDILTDDDTDYIITVTSEDSDKDEANITGLVKPRFETVLIPISNSARPIKLDIIQNEQTSIVVTSNTSPSSESHGQLMIKLTLVSSTDSTAEGAPIAENLLMYEVLDEDEEDLVIQLQIAPSKDNEGWPLWKIILVTIAAAVILTFVIGVIALCYRRRERRGRMEVMKRMRPIVEEKGAQPLDD